MAQNRQGLSTRVSQGAHHHHCHRPNRWLQNWFVLAAGVDLGSLVKESVGSPAMTVVALRVQWNISR